MEIKITQEHLAMGRRNEPDACVVALALKAQGFESVTAGPGAIQFEVPAGVAAGGERYGIRIWRRYQAKRGLTEFVRAFDNGESLSPGTLTLGEGFWDGAWMGLADYQAAAPDMPENLACARLQGESAALRIDIDERLAAVRQARGGGLTPR